MSRRSFFIRTAFYSVGFWVLLWIFRGFTFLVSHLPPGFVHLDWAVIGLSYLEQVMLFPRWVFRHLWLSETTPAFLNGLLGFLNCFAWGSAYAALTIRRHPVRGRPEPPPIIGA